LKTNAIKHILFFSLLLVILVYHFKNVIFNGHSFIFGDAAIQHYPHKVEYAKALDRGELILWQPLIGCGYPIHAEGEVGELYPLNLILFKVFNPLKAFNLSVFLHFMIGLFGMYILLIELKMSSLASFLGSIIFDFNSFSINNIEQINKIEGVTWLPLIVFLLLKSQKSGSLLFYFLYSISSGLMLLVAHPQIAFYNLFFAFLMVIFGSLSFSETRGSIKFLLKSMIMFILFTGLALIIASCQLVPLMELVKYSARSSSVGIDQKGMGSISLVDFFHLFSFGSSFSSYKFQLYIGLFPGIICFLAFYNKRYRREVLLLSIILAFLLVCALGSNTPIYPLIHKLPFFKLFWLPDRMIFLSVFIISILMAIGLDSLKDKIKNVNLRILITYILVLFVLVENTIILQKKFKSVKLIFKRPAVVDFLSNDPSDYRCYIYNIATIRSSISRFYPDSLASDTNILFEIPAINAYLPLIPETYLELFPGAYDNFLKTWKSKVFFPITREALNVLNVKYILSYANNIGSFPLVQRTSDSLNVFFNPDFTGKYSLFEKSKLEDIESPLKISVRNRTSENKLFGITVDKFRLRPSELHVGSSSDTADSSFVLIYSDNHKRKISIVTDRPTVLVNSENFYPGWKAHIDGIEHPIEKRLLSLMAIDVEPGKHTVVLEFKPFSYVFGCFLTMMSIMFVTIILVFLQFSKSFSS
jgi:hypothetical protein